MSKLLAWHFIGADKRLGYRDNRLVRRGHTFKCDPKKINLCKYGFHGSVNILDALEYAPGNVICRVELGGRIIKSNDKAVASERTVLKMADATTVLHEFAYWCTEESLKLIKNSDPRSIAAIQAKRDWLGLAGKITDAQLAAAASAREVAASAREIVADAAGDAWAAAWIAVWDAARAAQSKQLTKMVNEVLR